MAKAQRLRLTDVRRALRLVHDASEIGGDVLAWRRLIATELCRMTGARAAMHDEERVTTRPTDSRVEGFVVIGLDDAAARRGLDAYFEAGGFHAHPYFPTILPIANRPWTRVRRQLMADDRAYYGSPIISECVRAANVDDNIHSRQPIPLVGWANMIALFRGIDDPPFGVRDRRLVHLVHSELARLWRRPSGPPDPAASLPPRMRQIVHGFRTGMTEKEFAFQSGLAPATAHAYVTRLYRRLGVSSRFELLDRLRPPPRPMRPMLSYESRRSIGT